MIPVTRLAPKGNHAPLLEYLGHARPSQRLGQEGHRSFARATKDRRSASVVIQEEIEAVRKNYDFLSLAQVRMARIAFCRYMMARYAVPFTYRQSCSFFPSTTKAA